MSPPGPSIRGVIALVSSSISLSISVAFSSALIGCQTPMLAGEKEMVLASNVPGTSFRLRDYEIDLAPEEGWREIGTGQEVTVTVRWGHAYEIEAHPPGYHLRHVKIVEPVNRYAFRFVDADRVRVSKSSQAGPTITTGPTITIESPEGTTVSSEWITVIITGSAREGIAKLRITVNGDPVPLKGELEKTRGKAVSTGQRIPLIEGQNLIHVSLHDQAEEIGTSSLAVYRKGLADVPPDPKTKGTVVGKYKPGYARRIAALIGIDAYRHWPRLEGAVGDARRMAALLKEIGFDEVLELYDEDATRHGILTLLGERTPRIAGPEDLVVIFFAGHGQTETLPNERKQGYIVPVDGTLAGVFSTAISMETLRGLSDRLGAKHVYYAMDSCYSGLGFTRGIAFPPVRANYFDKITSNPVVQMITAGMEGEVAIERGGRGVFTSALIRGLEGGADLNQDGLITAGEVASFVRPLVTVESNGQQTPLAGTLSGSGEVVLVLP